LGELQAQTGIQGEKTRRGDWVLPEHRSGKGTEQKRKGGVKGLGYLKKVKGVEKRSKVGGKPSQTVPLRKGEGRK